MKRWISFIAILMIMIPVMGLATEGPIKAGRLYLRYNVTLGDVTLKPGSYVLQLVPKEEGMFIQILKNGQVLAEDLAIEREARFTRRKPIIKAGKVWNQNFYKITIHYGDKLYLAFLPIQ